jgi:hypothetical protein
MDGQAERCEKGPRRRPLAGYEPPRVESVLTPAELEREVLYAGATDASRPS